MARVPLVRGEDLPGEYRDVIESQLFRDRPDALGDRYQALQREDTALPSYRALANQPAALAALRAYQGTLWKDAGIDPIDRELVILTVARDVEAAYQWHSHVRVALVEGIAPEKLAALSRGDYDDFEPSEVALVRYVEAFVTDDVTDEVHEAMLNYYDESTVVGLAMVAGFYFMFSRLLGALDVELDEEFVGWELEHL